MSLRLQVTRSAAHLERNTDMLPSFSWLVSLICELETVSMVCDPLAVLGRPDLGKMSTDFHLFEHHLLKT